MTNHTNSPRHPRSRATRAAVALIVALVALIGLQSQSAGASGVVPIVFPYPSFSPTVRTAPTLSVSTVAVGNTVTAKPPTFSGTVTRIDYAWEYCTQRGGAALSCNPTGVWGNRYTPTLASTGGMTLAQWTSGNYHVRVLARGYNATGASAATYSPLTRVVPGAARGQLPLVQWWNGSTFAVSGAAAADGVDGAIPFRVRAVRWDGVTVGSTFGNTGLFRPDLRSIWPNTGNWGGSGTVVVNGASAATTVCLDVGLSYVQVLCQKLPPRPLT